MYQDNRVFDFCLTKKITLGEKEKRTGLAEIVAELATEVVAATFRPTAGSRHSNHNCTTKLTQLCNMWKERHITPRISTK